jgi:hypothetical protein
MFKGFCGCQVILRFCLWLRAWCFWLEVYDVKETNSNMSWIFSINESKLVVQIYLYVSLL